MRLPATGSSSRPIENCVFNVSLIRKDIAGLQLAANRRMLNKQLQTVDTGRFTNMDTGKGADNSP